MNSNNSIDLSESGRAAIDISIVHLENSLSIHCDGKSHPAGLDGHIPEQKATVAATFKCPNCGDALTALLCAGRLDWLQREARIGSKMECEICGCVTDLSTYMARIVPINGAGE